VAAADPQEQRVVGEVVADHLLAPPLPRRRRHRRPHDGPARADLIHRRKGAAVGDGPLEGHLHVGLRVVRQQHAEEFELGLQRAEDQLAAPRQITRLDLQAGAGFIGDLRDPDQEQQRADDDEAHHRADAQQPDQPGAQMPLPGAEHHSRTKCPSFIIMKWATRWASPLASKPTFCCSPS
jgi:hypothetical protein